MPEFMLRTLAQMLVILVPCYTVAYFTDKMVYVVPTLAAALVLSRAWPLKTDDDHDGEGAVPRVITAATIWEPMLAEVWAQGRVRNWSLPASVCA